MAVLVRNSPGSLVLVKAAKKEKKMRTLWELINEPWEGAPGTINHKSGIPGDGGGQMSHKELVMLAHMFTALTSGNVHHLHDGDAHPDPEHFGGGLVDPETGQKMVPNGDPNDGIDPVTGKPKSPMAALVKMGRDAIRVMHTRHDRHISEKGPNGLGPISSIDKKTGQPRGMRARDEKTGDYLPKYLDGPWGRGTGPMRVKYNKPKWEKRGPGSTKTTHKFDFDEGGLVTTKTFIPKKESGHVEGCQCQTCLGGGPPSHLGVKDDPVGPKTDAESSPLDQSFNSLSDTAPEGAGFGAASEGKQAPDHADWCTGGCGGQCGGSK